MVNARLWGAVLICAGFILTIAQMGYMSGEVFLLLVAAGLLAGYLLSGYRTGLLVGGACVGALGMFVAVDRYVAAGGWLFFLFLGIGFLLVLLVERLVGRQTDWPVYPGVVLVGFSAFIFLQEGGAVALSFAYARFLWPAVLVGLGLLLLLISFLRPTRRS